MKKVSALILALLMLPVFSVLGLTAEKRAPGAALNAAAGTAAVKTETQPVYSVVIGKNANGLERTAAEFLCETVFNSTGVRFDIVTDNVKTGNFEIAVGETNRLSADVSAFGDGGYVIKSYNGGAAVIGCGNKGVINGVVRILKDYGSYRCFIAGESFKNNGEALVVPDSINITYKPFFEYTESDWRLGGKNHIYAVTNGLNGGVYNRIPESFGGTVNYIGAFCHTFTGMFCSKDKYFAEHPEYFALRDGVRKDTQLCLTNENVFEIVRREVFELLGRSHDPKADLQILSLTQADNELYCECENCNRINNENGSQSGTIITFVNRIAAEVKAAGYDNVAIDTFAYQYSRKAPSKVKPLDNVIVRLCSIECCFAHTLDNADCELNREFMKDFADWGKICGRIYIWDYTTNYAHTLAFFPNFGVIQRNMQIFYENNAKGVYEEGAYYYSACDGEFGDLRCYLLTCLFTDPYCDLDAAMREFCEYHYGSGGGQIVEFVNFACENAAKLHFRIYAQTYDMLCFTDDETAYCDYLWEKAKLNSADAPEKLENIKRSEISWRMWKSSVKKGEYRGLSLVPERMRFYLDVIDLGITTYGEGDGDDILRLAFHKILGSPNEWMRGRHTMQFDPKPMMREIVELYDLFKALFGVFFPVSGCRRQTAR